MGQSFVAHRGLPGYLGKCESSTSEDMFDAFRYGRTGPLIRARIGTKGPADVHVGKFISCSKARF